MIVYTWKLLEALTRRDTYLDWGSQAATIKESLKFSPSISTHVVQSDKVAATEAKIEALIVELEQNNLEQEMLKQKMEHCEQIFGRFVPSINQNSPVQLEREGDKENYEIDANENDVMDDED
ncbi:unnamed protein product [Trifolium pratense]|uniref:Uncharacterized protein n=1 Tax=Trifolium pratense TaxID=57577 RepID=A0ACB0K1A8_TRIPR|nr:unnamed protein product [Trifolium pratense]